MVRLAPLFNPSTPSTGSKRCNYKQSSFCVTIPSIPVTILIPRRYTQLSSPTLRFHFRARARLPYVSRSSPFPAFLSPDSTASRAHRFQERVAERSFERKRSRSGNGSTPAPIPTDSSSIFRCARKIELSCIHFCTACSATRVNGNEDTRVEPLRSLFYNSLVSFATIFWENIFPSGKRATGETENRRFQRSLVNRLACPFLSISTSFLIRASQKSN